MRFAARSLLSSGRQESGQSSVLIIGFAVVLLLMTGVVVDSSAAYLQRQRLDTLADGAALAAADRARGAAIYEGGVDGHVPITAATAREAVLTHLQRVDAWSSHPGLQVDVSIREESVVVRLEAPLELPFRVGEIGAATVGATGAAEVRVDTG